MLTDQVQNTQNPCLIQFFEKTGDAGLINMMVLDVIRVVEEIRLQRVSSRKLTDYLKTS